MTSPVYAQESTPTFQPIYNQPTPNPKNNTCPGYQPIGWGQKTPDPVWYQNCSHCITPQAGDPWDWGENPLIPTVSTPTITPTSQFTATYNIYNSTGDILEGYSYVGGGSQLYLDQINFDQTNGTGLSYAFTIVIQVKADWIGYGSSTCAACSMGITLENRIAQEVKFEVIEGQFTGNTYTLASGGSQRLIFGQTTQCKFDEPEFIDEYFVAYVTVTNDGHATEASGWIKPYWSQIFWRGYPITQVGYRWFDGHVLDYGPMPGPTPTPASDYCNEVIGEGDGDPDDGFNLPVPGLGPTVCASTPLSGVTIGMGWFNTLFSTEVDDITIPGMEFCVQAIEFGDIQMFGITVSLDLMSFVMAGVFFIRMILRS